MKKSLTQLFLVISLCFLLCFSISCQKQAEESRPIEPIIPPITEETASRLEFEKNNVLANQVSPLHLDIELMDGGSKINFIFTPFMPSGTMKKEELLQQISGYVTFVAYELTENPNWVNCGGHVRFVFEDQGEIARVSLPVCEKFMQDFKDWDKAWKYLSDNIEWTKKK
ncbi:hypothetical protein LCGC14_1060380 [marine sediment metagenome]|uniref:Lipoprotein n=1 Tax=marine sediment metagenome TaxID=412755 RepID=A0A0F9Q470_9ZZZZ|nr:hypothetical protein [Candidatus Aminicenantes bacterium]HEB36028.1 hypothetical protein [Candidatus Aminicenantes bacterium]